MAKTSIKRYINLMPRATNLAPKPDIAPAAPAGWAELLDRSEAQIATGQTMPLEPLLDELRASIARMEAKRAKASQK